LDLGIALLLTATVLAGAAPAGAECDVGICPGDPCTVTGKHVLDEECVLDFGDRDVTLAPGATLIVDQYAEVSARNLTVQGRIQGQPLFIAITVTQDFRTEGRGRLLGRRVSEDGGNVSIEAGGDVTFDGASFRLAGDWAYLQVIAGGTLRVDAPMELHAWFSDVADLQFQGASIITTAPITTRGRGIEAGSSIFMYAFGDVAVGKRLGLSRDRFGGFPLEVRVEAGGDVSLPKMTFRSAVVGGRLFVEAGGDITLVGNVSAKGYKGSETVGEGGGGHVELHPGPTGIVTMQGQTVNTSCGPGCEVPGSIEVTTSCYTDVTDAQLSARIDGTIDLGCSCIHPASSPVCDGGCVGLATATFDPPIPTALPPCS
jgi:hypothetical protein